MIRINLLYRTKKKKKPSRIPGYFLVTLLLVFIVLLGIAFISITTEDEMDKLNSKKAVNEKRISELKAELKELEDYEGLVNTVEEKKKIIIQLRENQSIPVKLLLEISKNLPNGVWLNTMTVAGNIVTIEGLAFTNSDVVAYVNNLKNSPFLDSVYLSESRRAGIREQNMKEDVTVYNFRISFNMKG